MRLSVNYFILIWIIIPVFTLYSNIAVSQSKKDIIIENDEMCLIIGTNGRALSLINKAVSRECLQLGTNFPVFSVTQYMPYEDELQLSRPAKSTTFSADSIVRIGDDFTSINFGFIRYVLPGLSTIGTQLDMIEYICSPGAAWDSPIDFSYRKYQSIEILSPY